MISVLGNQQKFLVICKMGAYLASLVVLGSFSVIMLVCYIYQKSSESFWTPVLDYYNPEAPFRSLQ